jgi:hypothetical protein
MKDQEPVEQVEPLEPEELEEQPAEPLPDREAMSVISPDPVIWDLPVEPRDGV